MDNERILKLNLDANIIPPEELDILRIKMGKTKRKEADWDAGMEELCFSGDQI